jgi:hypothetical protein
MGEAEDSQAEGNDLSGGSQENRGGAESTVGEGEARSLKELRIFVGFERWNDSI